MTRGGDAHGAARRVAAAPAADPHHLQLRAVAQRRSGNLEEARRLFATAWAAAPDDPDIANNYANLLRQMDEVAEALALYDRALALRPDHRDAAFNKALLLSKGGNHDGALVLLDRLTARDPRDARAHSARGTILRRCERLDDAALAYDHALGCAPNLPSALSGRAQVALERGEGDAPDRFRHALAAAPGDLGLMHGYAEALEAAGEAGALEMLNQILAARPDWTTGHALLARIGAERGDSDWFAAMQDAVRRRPGDRALTLTLANMLAAAERWDDALATLPGGDDPAVAKMRAHCLGEAGRPEEALALLAQLPQHDTGTAIVAARAHLRRHDAAQAAHVLERAVENAPEAVSAWGHLELAWRLTGDPRGVWLSGQPNLIAVCDTGLGQEELAELADVLRGLHRTRAHPVGQSLRGGTQTRGRLFARTEPVLAQLRAAATAAIAAYADGLPPVDPAHPLLRHRNASVRLGGSWSVRLSGAGFHVNHIHSEGIISSACYIALPDRAADEDERAGWLELGRAPAELEIELAPLRSVEPRVGRLALFPSYLFHGTRPFGAGERLSVAFDVVAP